MNQDKDKLYFAELNMSGFVRLEPIHRGQLGRDILFALFEPSQILAVLEDRIPDYNHVNRLVFRFKKMKDDTVALYEFWKIEK